jgi:hypothetical protein
MAYAGNSFLRVPKLLVGYLNNRIPGFQLALIFPERYVLLFKM